MMVRIRVAALALGAAFVSLSPGSASAVDASVGTAQTAASGVEFVSMATLRCLDSNHRGDVYTLGCNKGDNQKWEGAATHHSNGQIWNVGTGRCLQRSSAGSGPIITDICRSGNDLQQWNLATNGSPVAQVQRGSICLDSNSSGNVYSLTCNGGNYQKWYRTYRSE